MASFHGRVNPCSTGRKLQCLGTRERRMDSEAQLLPPHCVPLPRHAALTPWVAEPTDVSLQGAGAERKLDGRRQREAPHRIISLTNFLRILMLGTQKRRDSCTNELRLVGLNPSADVFCLLKEADGVV